ncbi:hypothetical protein [Stenotrophomonas sp. PS02300]|uniref:hypothetical protein n=1 Tax=Stenotrophomonas sp. PS02300 TaxID=2991426 RepID=UPI002499B9DC|nr:hypothetical protein [Stenotrophomonas sp. PS02300]
MPRSVSQSGAPVVAPQINNRPNLKGIFGKLSIHDVRNVAQSAIPCRLAYTPGVHERTANSSAISVAYDVMEAGRSGLSRSDAKALDKAMWQFSPQSPIRLGGKLQCYMTVLGAERASVALLLRESAGDERLSRCLSRCLDQLDRAIVKVAVRIGKCDGVPDGAFHGDPKSKKLFDEIEVAKGVMTRCVREVGGGEVMRGIAEAILPSAMRDSVAERLPDSFAKFDRADGAPDILNVLQVDEALSLQRVIGNMLEDGSPEALAEAVLHLLKAPEYVEQSQPGGKPDKPDKPPRTPPPANPPQALQPHACSGAASLHNNAPVNIDNKVDFDISKLFKLLDKPPLQWTDVRNLIEEMRKDAYSLGRSEERNLIQDELIAEQRELIAQQKQEIADLKERFLEKNRSLQAWANGSGLTRATPASTREQGTGTEHQLRDATTSTWDLDQVEVDSSSLRNSGTPDLTRRENQLDRQNRQNQQERRTDNEHSEQRQVNSRGNGSGGPRNNNLPPEDEVDNTSRPINRASTSRTPDDEALNRLNQNNRNNENNQNQRQRLGNTEQRLEGQRTERNRHLQRGNDEPLGQPACAIRDRQLRGVQALLEFAGDRRGATGP